MSFLLLSSDETGPGYLMGLLIGIGIFSLVIAAELWLKRTKKPAPPKPRGSDHALKEWRQSQVDYYHPGRPADRTATVGRFGFTTKRGKR